MQTPVDIFYSVIGILVWVLDIMLISARIGFEWFREHIGLTFFIFLAKFITDAIILALSWVQIIIKWLTSVVLALIIN
ncbi:MAG TPA: hypothetical protein VJK04_03295 [Candidatus Paceibacterota bacterium]